MPLGRLEFATRRVDLMTASMRALLALYGWHDHFPPNKAWEKVDQMVVWVQGASMQRWVLEVGSLFKGLCAPLSTIYFVFSFKPVLKTSVQLRCFSFPMCQWLRHLLFCCCHPPKLFQFSALVKAETVSEADGSGVFSWPYKPWGLFWDFSTVFPRTPR